MFDAEAKEIIIIAVILALLLGTRRIPELAKGIADAIRHLQGTFTDDEPSPSTHSKDNDKR